LYQFGLEIKEIVNLTVWYPRMTRRGPSLEYFFRTWALWGFEGGFVPPVALEGEKSLLLHVK